MGGRSKPPNSRRVAYTDDLDEETAAFLDRIDPLKDNPCQLSEEVAANLRDDGTGPGRLPYNGEHAATLHGERFRELYRRNRGDNDTWMWCELVEYMRGVAKAVARRHCVTVERIMDGGDRFRKTCAARAETIRRLRAEVVERRTDPGMEFQTRDMSPLCSKSFNPWRPLSVLRIADLLQISHHTVCFQLRKAGCAGKSVAALIGSA